MSQALKKLIELSKHNNIAKNKDDDFLLKLGENVVKFAQEDDSSRENWKKKSEAAIKHALQITEEKNSPWPNASNVKYPHLTIAALQFNARAYPAVIQGNRVVATKITGQDSDDKKMDQATRIEKFMNWQLLEQQDGWEEQLDKITIALPIEGCEFKKTFFNPNKGRNVSEWVRPIDFIVHNSTKDIDTCPRYTHRIWLSPRDIMERQRAGLWLDVDLNISADDLDKETLQEFYEQHCFIDLDDDGYKEPYSVTVHVESESVVRIKADFLPEDITVSKDDKSIKLDSLIFKGIDINQLSDVLKGVKIVSIDRFSYFTKYSFIPSPDGSFYDIGFGQLILSLNDSIDTNINQINDAGTLANSQTGFIRDGIEIDSKRGNVSTKMGEFKRISVPSGTSVRDAIMPMQYPGPSPVLFNMLGMLSQGIKDITSVQDIFTGGQQRNETATTTLARVEQGMKVFTAIYKRIYRALKRELKINYRLNSIFLSPETYFRVLDTNEKAVISLSDFRNDGTDVQPIGDPSISTLAEKLAKAQLVREEAQINPIINRESATRRFLEAIEVPNIDDLIIPKEQRQAQPDPAMIELQVKILESKARTAKTEAELEQVRATTIKTYADAVNAIASAESKEAGSQLAQYRANLETIIKSIELKKAMIDGETGIERMDGPSGDDMANEEAGQLPGSMQNGSIEGIITG